MSRDAEYLFGEHPGHRNHLVAVLFFDAGESDATAVTEQSVRQWVSERLACSPVFTRRVQREMFDLDYPYWVGAEPDLDRHVHFHTVNERGWAPVEALLSPVVESPMDLSRPLWELHVVTGIRGVHDLPESVIAVFLKVHHCAADGLAMREMTLGLFARSWPAATVAGQSKAASKKVRIQKGGMAIRAIARIPRVLIRFGRGVADARAAAKGIADAEKSGAIAPAVDATYTPLNGVVSGEISIDFVTMRLDAISTIRRAVPGATVNDVLLSVVSGALREFSVRGEDLAKVSLVAKVPRSMRTVEDWTSANQLVLLSVPLHNETTAPLSRLAGIVQSSRKAKERSGFPAMRRYVSRIESSPALLLKASALGSKLVAQSASAAQAGHTIVSNIALDAMGREFFGCQYIGALPNQPPGNGDLLRHYMCFKDTEVLTLNVLADTSVLPAVGEYRTMLTRSFESLLASATESLSSADVEAR